MKLFEVYCQLEIGLPITKKQEPQGFSKEINEVLQFLNLGPIELS